MIHIYSCHNHSIVKSVKTPSEADVILRGPSAVEGFALYALDSESRHVGDCVEGYTGRLPSDNGGLYAAQYAYACGYRD